MQTTFQNAIETHREALNRAALKFCHGEMAFAEDMVQETFLKALKNEGSFTEGSNLRAWLMRILYNNVMSVFRHRQVAREGPLPEGLDPLQESPPSAEVSDEIVHAVDNLPEDYRKVFLMSALEESPYQEIADKLGIPVGTVMSRLWRARKTLQQRLAPVSLN